MRFLFSTFVEPMMNTCLLIDSINVPSRFTPVEVAEFFACDGV